MEAWPLWCGRLAVTAFFAVAFLQSAVDKVVDRQGNLAYLTSHFASSPLRGLVQPLFLAITLLESIAGVLCGLGALCLLVGCGTGLAFSLLLPVQYNGSIVIPKQSRFAGGSVCLSNESDT